MARFKAIAGYFKEVITQQPVTIKQTIHKTDESGMPMFEENGTKPITELQDVKVMVDVKDRVWVDQVNIPFTPEEEAARDAEEALHEIEKSKPVPLTSAEEMDLLLSEGVEAVKQRRAQHQEQLANWQKLADPLIEASRLANALLAEINSVEKTV